MLLFSLSNTPRNKLLEWYEDVCAQARGLCAAFDIAGALSLVAYPSEWNAYPGNVTNAADVLANGDPLDFRARPTFAQPADHPDDDDAAAGILSVHKRAMDKHHAYTMASSTLNVALLASIGLDNRVLLQAVYNPIPLYALTPLQIVEAMFAEHGVLAGTDLSRLRAPLQEPLSAVADLERHMNKFMLAAKKLTVSGQGKTAYEYFEAFLETVQGFPVVPQNMSTYYAIHPTVQQQTIDTLFPYLKSQHPHMLRTSGASPFFGAVTPAPAAVKPQRPKKLKQKKWGPNGAQQTGNHRGTLAGGMQGPHGLSLEALSLQNQVQQLTALLAQSNANVAAAMMGENFGAVAAATGYGMPTVPSAFFGSQERPFYCFVHGSNTSHNGAQCKVMAQNPLYTVDVKTATSSATGGNPNVGPPVSRPMLLAFAPAVVCSPCALFSLTQASANKRPRPMTIT
jgi:hypothetical protein